MSYKIDIDKNAGFCFGVVKAIDKAEDFLNNHESLYCLGDIVHNEMETERLKEKGLIVIDHEQFKTLKDCKVLLRAHGEPPETYEIAEKNNIELIDASCPLVLRLQKKVRESALEAKGNEKIIIFGNPDHPEVIGLVGQSPDKTVVISSIEEVETLSTSGNIFLYSQTTKDKDKYTALRDRLEEKLQSEGKQLKFTDSICNQVHKRRSGLAEFCEGHDVVLFVGGKKSSNAKVLFNVCKQHNPNTYFVSETADIKKEWFSEGCTIGITGATSTPQWLMTNVGKAVEALI